MPGAAPRRAARLDRLLLGGGGASEVAGKLGQKPQNAAWRFASFASFGGMCIF